MASGHTITLGVIGCPIEHSLSPAMHSAAILHLGLDATYVRFRVEPGAVPDAMRGVRALGMRGINVTIPHKKAAAECCGRLDRTAIVAGGVNTVVNDNGELVGISTDGEGFLRSLKDEGIDLTDARVVMAGAGGSARAIAAAILPRVAALHVAARRTQSVATLRQGCPAAHTGRVSEGGLSAEELAGPLREATVLINATPLGMWPATETCLAVSPEMLHPGMLVIDIVPNPLRTRLMCLAEEAGCRTVSGIGMLVHQGAVAFGLWTGLDAPVEVMKQACVTALQSFD
jgi:shikimate dehydrogenase